MKDYIPFEKWLELGQVKIKDEMLYYRYKDDQFFSHFGYDTEENRNKLSEYLTRWLVEDFQR